MGSAGTRTNTVRKCDQNSVKAASDNTETISSRGYHRQTQYPHILQETRTNNNTATYYNFIKILHSKQVCLWRKQVQTNTSSNHHHNHCPNNPPDPQQDSLTPRKQLLVLMERNIITITIIMTMKMRQQKTNSVILSPYWTQSSHQ